MFAERLKKLRIEAGLTQKNIADNFQIKQPTYAQWEQGKRNPSESTLNKFADFFNVSTDYLLGKTDIKNPIEHQLENAELLFRTTVKDLNLTPAQQEQFKIDIANFIEERKKLFEEDK